MRVLQVLGANGAGKTALLTTLARLDPQRLATPMFDEGPAAHIGERRMTALPTLGGVMVGDYSADYRCPGLDLSGGHNAQARILARLDRAWTLAAVYRSTWLAWEGIMVMTRNYHHHLLARGATEVHYLHLVLPVEECFRRIEARGGKARAAMAHDGARVISRVRTAQTIADWALTQPCAVVHRWDATFPLDTLAAWALHVATHDH